MWNVRILHHRGVATMSLPSELTSRIKYCWLSML